MLKKLLRYEFRYHARLILISYAVLAGYLLITRLAIEFSGYAISKELFAVFTFSMLPTAMIFMGAMLLVGTVCALPMILGAVRFYRNLITDEGYLTFTLPVPTASHILAKTLVPILYSLLSIVVSCLLCGLTACIGTDLLQSLVGAFGAALDAFTPSAQVYLLTVLVLWGLSALVLTIVTANFSVAVGQNFQKFRLGAAIITYYLSNSMLSFVKSMITNTYYIVSSDSTSSLILIHGLTLQVVLSVIALVPMYWYTNHIFKNKLNLQ